MTIEVRKRSRLPHWHGANAPYFVTWNLADAIPSDERERIEQERRALTAELERRKGLATPAEKWALEELIRERVEALLDAGHGECLLRNKEIARIVESTLHHFDLERYELLSYSVMPNHVHVVFTLGSPSTLDSVIKSWKGYTAHEANKALARSGTFWQQDYLDRTIRERDHLLSTVAYVEGNPISAGLHDWPWVKTYRDRIG